MTLEMFALCSGSFYLAAFYGHGFGFGSVKFSNLLQIAQLANTEPGFEPKKFLHQSLLYSSTSSSGKEKSSAFDLIMLIGN